MSTSDTIQRLAADLRDAIGQIQAEHKRLAERPTLTASGSLSEATARRDRLVGEIGRVVADALLSGNSLSFTAAPEVPEGEQPTSAAPVVQTAAPMETYRSSNAPRETRYVARRAPVRRERETFDAQALQGFVDEMGSAEELDTIQQFDQRYQALRYAASHPNRWIDLPPKAQRHLIGGTVALLRDLQEANEEFGRPLREPEIVGLISRLSHWSKEHRPGWVNGMARGAVPDEGEWLLDAQMHIEELQVLIDDVTGEPPAPPAAVTPAKPLADTSAAAAPDVEDDSDPIHRPCPACSAEPGERCKTDSGRKLYSYHHKERR